MSVSAPVLPVTTIVSVSNVVARPHGAIPTMMRPRFAPVPTETVPESPAAVMVIVAVVPPKTQPTAALATAGKASRATALTSAVWMRRRGRTDPPSGDWPTNLRISR